MKRVVFLALSALILIAGCEKKTEMAATTSTDTSSTDTAHKKHGKFMGMEMLRGIGNPTTTITPPAAGHPEQPLNIILSANPDAVIIGFAFGGDQGLLQEITLTTPDGVQVFANQQMIPNTRYIAPGQENTYVTSEPNAHITVGAMAGNPPAAYTNLTSISATGSCSTQYSTNDGLHQSIISVIAVP